MIIFRYNKYMKNIELIKQILFTILDILTISILVITFYITIPLKSPVTTVTIPKGSVTNIIKTLQNRGFSLSPIDIYLLVAIGEPKSGELKIKRGYLNRIDFLYKLTNSVTEKFNIVTLIPGETKEIFFKNLAKKYKLNYKKLYSSYLKYSSYSEAGIIPDTYHIPKDIDEDKIIKILVRDSEKRYRKIALKEFKRYDKNEFRLYLIIASIIQKEAGNREEMGKISSVIYNRLRRGMPLQMDGTLNYGIYSHTKVTPKRIKSDRSGFNTYLNRGLPPYPICSVSIDALYSALYPDKSDYLFFMKNGKGGHDFSSSYRGHLKNIERAKKR